MTMTSDQLWSRLLDHGFRPIRRTTGSALFDKDGNRVLVPDEPGRVPDWIERSIEWQLAPQLGSGWLSPDDGAPEAHGNDADATRQHIRDDAERRILHRVVVRRDPDGEQWQAFVADEPRIAVCGASLEDARDRAHRAVALWYDVHPDLVTLVTLEPLPSPTDARPGDRPGADLPSAARRTVTKPTATSEPSQAQRLHPAGRAQRGRRGDTATVAVASGPAPPGAPPGPPGPPSGPPPGPSHLRRRVLEPADG